MSAIRGCVVTMAVPSGAKPLADRRLPRAASPCDTLDIELIETDFDEQVVRGAKELQLEVGVQRAAPTPIRSAHSTSGSGAATDRTFTIRGACDCELT